MYVYSKYHLHMCLLSVTGDILAYGQRIQSTRSCFGSGQVSASGCNTHFQSLTAEILEMVQTIIKSIIKLRDGAAPLGLTSFWAMTL